MMIYILYICLLYTSLNESEYQEACDTYGRSAFRVGMGAESIHELLAAIDLETVSYTHLEQQLRRRLSSM